jgi:hypothetical protein
VSALFYSACATAAAPLTGLLFVAVQLGPPLAATGRVGRRHAIARSTFTIFVLVFTLSLFFMAPGQTLEAHVIAAIVVATGGAARAVRTWLPVWRDKLHGRIEFRLVQTGWMLVGPLLAYVYLVLGAVVAERQNDSAVLDHTSEIAFIVLFAAALRNAWTLLVEARSSDSEEISQPRQDSHLPGG